MRLVDADKLLKTIDHLPIVNNGGHDMILLSKRSVMAVIRYAQTARSTLDVPDINVGRWISTADKLPEEGQICVIAEKVYGNYGYCLGFYHKGTFCSNDFGQLSAIEVNWWYAVPEIEDGESDD